VNTNASQRAGYVLPEHLLRFRKRFGDDAICAWVTDWLAERRWQRRARTPLPEVEVRRECLDRLLIFGRCDLESVIETYSAPVS
jgi:hypothetical protein